MNALARSVSLTLPRQAAFASPARRQLTTWPELKKNWLSDPGAYPVIGILCIAVVGCSIKGAHYLATNPDARIKPSTRAAPLRTWG